MASEALVSRLGAIFRYGWCCKDKSKWTERRLSLQTRAWMSDGDGDVEQGPDSGWLVRGAKARENVWLVLPVAPATAGGQFNSPQVGRHWGSNPT